MICAHFSNDLVLRWYLIRPFKAVLKISAILLKDPTFESGFFHVFKGKIDAKLDFLHIVASTIKSWLPLSGEQLHDLFSSTLKDLQTVYEGII